MSIFSSNHIFSAWALFYAEVIWGHEPGPCGVRRGTQTRARECQEGTRTRAMWCQEGDTNPGQGCQDRTRPQASGHCVAY